MTDLPPALVGAHPPFGLVLRAGDLTLRPLAEPDMPAYLELLREPIFAGTDADHVFPWYRKDPETRLREALHFQWHQRAAFSPEDWSLPFGVWTEGGTRLIGCQDVAAREFAVRRTVGTGSWLTLSAHGRGHGGLMRRMMLILAFDHLGAVRAETSAVLGNDASFGVSRSCGYAEEGLQITAEDGTRVVQQRFAITPDTFARRGVVLEVEGLTPELRTMLGA